MQLREEMQKTELLGVRSKILLQKFTWIIILTLPIQRFPCTIIILISEPQLLEVRADNLDFQNFTCGIVKWNIYIDCEPNTF